MPPDRSRLPGQLQGLPNLGRMIPNRSATSLSPGGHMIGKRKARAPKRSSSIQGIVCVAKRIAPGFYRHPLVGTRSVASFGLALSRRPIVSWYDPSTSHGRNKVLGQVDAPSRITPRRGVLPRPVDRLGNRSPTMSRTECASSRNCASVQVISPLLLPIVRTTFRIRAGQMQPCPVPI